MAPRVSGPLRRVPITTIIISWGLLLLLLLLLLPRSELVHIDGVDLSGLHCPNLSYNKSIRMY